MILKQMNLSGLQLTAALFLVICSTMAVSANEVGNQPVKISADRLEAQIDKNYILHDNATVKSGNRTIRADKIIYDPIKDVAQLQNNVSMQEEGAMLINCDSGSYSPKSSVGSFVDAQYYVYTKNYAYSAADDLQQNLPKNPEKGSETDSVKLFAQGRAERVDVSNKSLATLKQATYSTCPRDGEDWHIASGKITLNQETQQGSATHARLEMFGVPLFYTPYIRFPIGSQRQSGFLFPYISYDDISGIDLRIPYYLNLAPEYDATLTPRILGRRGVALETEFRFLTENQNGELNVDYLADDDIYGDSRLRSSYKQSGKIGTNTTNAIGLNYVSDEDYFDDLGDGGAPDYLRSQISFNHSRGNLSFGFLSEGYQIINENTSEPYRRLPQLSSQYQKDLQYLQADFAAQITRFDHDEETKIKGDRYNLDLTLKRRFSSMAYFLEPGIILANRSYSLEENQPEDSQSNSFNTWTAYIDSAVFLERDFSLFGRDYTQSLEPRLFLLYTPYEDQSDIPNFDSSENGFGATQLFATNRFSGGDRISDANNLSLAITNRLFHKGSGYEYGNITIGEIFYLQPHQVGIGGNIDTEGQEENSNLVAQFSLYPTITFSSQMEVLWNHGENFVQSVSLINQYSGKDLLLNLNHNWQRNDSGKDADTTDLSEISIDYKVTGRWRTFGKWRYSHLHERTAESLAGFRYQTCCWSATLVKQRYLDEISKPEEPSSKLMFQLKFFGLSGIGKNINDILSESISGFKE